MNGFTSFSGSAGPLGEAGRFKTHRVPVSEQAGDERFQYLGLQEALWQ